MAQFYTYLHCKPDGTPFYVGKGTGCRAHDFGHRSEYHRNIVSKHGHQNIGVFIFPCESEQQAIADEIQQIAQLRAEGYALCNLTDGGDGISGLRHSEQTKKKMSLAALGKMHSLETRLKISTAKRNPTDTARANISAAKIGRKRPPFSAIHRERMALKALGNQRGVGNKSTLGQKASAETRAKMSASQKRCWAIRKYLTQQKN